jgi:hypothetical protein
MVLSKRERIILIIALTCVGLLAVYKFVVEPVDLRLDDMQTQRTQLESELAKADILMVGQADRRARWKAQMPEDLRDAGEVRTRISKSITDWADRAGLSLTSTRADQAGSEKDLQEMVFTVIGKGPLDGVTQFLWLVETASLPVKIKSVHLGSSSDDGSSMSIELHLSVLYPSAESTQVVQKAPEATNEEDM